MEVDNEYYKNIIYKKNAFGDLKTYIKINYSNKNILLISSKSVPSEDVTEVLNALFCGSEKVAHFVCRDNFNNTELDALNKKIVDDEPNLLIALGAGKVCDAVKYFASKYNKPYVVCPTLATSLAYFSAYCVNPYDAKKSFYAKFPNKIFIQESIIKNASLHSNINGLCFLNAFRCVFAEGVDMALDKDKYVYLGMEKILNKLEQEQNNILLCGEDSNLVLMDLFIDLGFFVSRVDVRKFYLLNMFNYYSSLMGGLGSFSGKNLLLCAKVILSVFEEYFELRLPRMLEKPNFIELSKIIKKHNFSVENIKNNTYYCNFLLKNRNKYVFFTNKSNCYKTIFCQIYKINEFTKAVKSIYKYGVELDGDFNKIATSLAITPYISGDGVIMDFIAASGVLNAFVG